MIKTVHLMEHDKDSGLQKFFPSLIFVELFLGLHAPPPYGGPLIAVTLVLVTSSRGDCVWHRYQNQSHNQSVVAAMLVVGNIKSAHPHLVFQYMYT